jgi:hypothetical protein
MHTAATVPINRTCRAGRWSQGPCRHGRRRAVQQTLVAVRGAPRTRESTLTERARAQHSCSQGAGQKGAATPRWPGRRAAGRAAGRPAPVRLLPLLEYMTSAPAAAQGAPPRPRRTPPRASPALPQRLQRRGARGRPRAKREQQRAAVRKAQRARHQASAGAARLRVAARAQRGAGRGRRRRCGRRRVGRQRERARAACAAPARRPRPPAAPACAPAQARSKSDPRFGAARRCHRSALQGVARGPPLPCTGRSQAIDL